MHLLKVKCLPVLFYGLNACPLNATCLFVSSQLVNLLSGVAPLHRLTYVQLASCLIMCYVFQLKWVNSMRREYAIKRQQLQNPSGPMRSSLVSIYMPIILETCSFIRVWPVRPRVVPRSVYYSRWKRIKEHDWSGRTGQTRMKEQALFKTVLQIIERECPCASNQSDQDQDR